MIIVGIILLVISVIKFIILIPGIDQINDFASSDIVDLNKSKLLLQWLIAFEAGLELIASLFIIFIV